ncbi:MAG: SMI1/KNR4 family protein [Bacteroidetes bacterium]|nr:SMI1/KNR4 family protein [Bacteroidota bacterium]
MNHLKKAFEIIDKYLKLHKDSVRVGKPIDEDIIQKNEKLLNLSFPPTYREFLKKYGFLEINTGSIKMQVYGISKKKDFDIIEINKSIRNKENLPKYLIVISRYGFGWATLNLTSIRNKENHICYWDGFNDEDQIFNNFAEFLYEELMENLKPLPKLFCKKEDVIILKKELEIKLDNNKTFTFTPNTKFKVNEVIGYGFDLICLDNKREIRLMNSELSLYF